LKTLTSENVFQSAAGSSLIASGTASGAHERTDAKKVKSQITVNVEAVISISNHCQNQYFLKQRLNFRLPAMELQLLAMEPDQDSPADHFLTYIREYSEVTLPLFICALSI
jgi:hypothetical protein